VAAGYDFALVDRISVPAEIHAAFTEKLLYVPSSFSYQANDMPFDAAPCRYLRHHHHLYYHHHNYSGTKVFTDDRDAPLGPSAPALRASFREECQARIEGPHTTGAWARCCE
jgi:hypothetical protein